jgi:integrase
MHVTTKEMKPGVWRIRIETGKDKEGKRLFKYETLHGTKDDAGRRRYEILNAHEEGTFAAPDKVTLSVYFKRWNKYRQVAKQISRSSAETYATWFRLYIEPDLGGMRVQKIEGAHIQALYTKLLVSEGRKKPLSQNTVFAVHALVAEMFVSIRKAKIVRVNPLEEIDPPAPEKREPKAIEEARAIELLETLAGDWKEPVAFLGFGAGMRRGELSGLRFRACLLDAATIRVEGQIVEYRDGTWEWLAPKSEAGVRTIAIDENLVDMLRRLKVESKENYLKLGIPWTEDAYVFTRDGHAPVLPNYLGHSFSDHCAKHGLPAFTLHGTRHTHLTALLKRVGKEGARAVQERAGHSDITTTLRTYQKVFENDRRELAGLTSTLTKGAGKKKS